MSTRIVHHVRITNPNDDEMWVEVKVHDTVMFKGPNGQDMVLDFRQQNVVPQINDYAGGGNGVNNARPTRISHIERITNPDDDTNYLDVEILDGIAFTGPNGKQGILKMPSNRSGISVRDTDGTGATGNGGNTQRAYTLKAVDPTSDVAPEDEQEDFIGVNILEAIRFKGENGNDSVLYLPNVTETDTTVWEEDDEGNPKAPENTDANKYICWPDENGGPDGPWLKNGDNGYGISQGILWHITKAAGGVTRPWWTYQPTTQPMQWTEVLYAERLFNEFGSWIGYHNFRLVWYYRDEYGHVEDYAVPDPPRFPGTKIPLVGFDSLDDAASATPRPLCGKIDFTAQPTEPTVSSTGVGTYRPNIWQMTGFEQPFAKDRDGNFILDEDGNKIPKMPSKKRAEKVVLEYQRLWNDASSRYDANEALYNGLDVTNQVGVNYYFPYPTWDFVTPQPVPNPSLKSQRNYFTAGIPSAFRAFGGILGGSASLTSWAAMLGVDQLDEDIWDVSGNIPVKWSPSHPKP